MHKKTISAQPSVYVVNAELFENKWHIINKKTIFSIVLYAN